MVPAVDRLPETITRRSVIRGAAAVTVGSTAGCIQRAQSLLGRRRTGQLSLSIKTVPADADRGATIIARQLGDHLESAGIDSSVVLESEDELRRSTLISHDFDLYIARYPDHHDPDFLRPLLHSVYVDEPGWQNPFGFADLTVDELLDRQRTTEGGRRRAAVEELLRSIGQLQPFTVIANPDEVRAVRNDRFRGWRSPGLASSLGYLSLRRVTDADPGVTALRVTITDKRITRNFNPIAVEFRNRGTITGLLYDPLVRWEGGEAIPWLAEAWSWNEPPGGPTTAQLRLRPDLLWHDGRPLTATDVAFTYRFLQDTSLGEGSTAAPAPRFRGRVSLVESVDPIDDRTLKFAFGETSPVVARQAFMVPILPEHEWRPRAVPVNLAGLELFDGVTEALVWENQNPIGSGPLRFERSIVDELLVLRRFDRHFLHRSDSDSPYAGGIPYDELIVRYAPSDSAAVELIALDEADATASSVGSNVVPTIGRRDQLQLVVTPSRSFYHLGFNHRREPLGNPRFRLAIARLIDKAFITRTVFDGFATPSAGPLSGTGWTPPDHRWDGQDPVAPFVGVDGELDVPAAQALFREVGYQYDEAGRLLDR